MRAKMHYIIYYVYTYKVEFSLTLALNTFAIKISHVIHLCLHHTLQTTKQILCMISFIIPYCIFTYTHRTITIDKFINYKSNFVISWMIRMGK